MNVVGKKIVTLESIERQAFTLEEATEKVRDVHKIQGQWGNWNYDQYMRGMFNGLELALCILEKREPDFRSLRERDALVNKPKEKNRKPTAVDWEDCPAVSKSEGFQGAEADHCIIDEYTK